MGRAGKKDYSPLLIAYPEVPLSCIRFPIRLITDYIRLSSPLSLTGRIRHWGRCRCLWVILSDVNAFHLLLIPFGFHSFIGTMQFYDCLQVFCSASFQVALGYHLYISPLHTIRGLIWNLQTLSSCRFLIVWHERFPPTSPQRLKS